MPALPALGLIAALACLGVARGARPLLSRLRAPAQPASAEPPDPVDAARARLEQFEVQRRSATDFAHLPPANLTHGADPYALARLDARHLVGVLRGASALVLLDDELRELQRIELPGSAVTATVTDTGECWVAGEASHELRQFHFDGHSLRPVSSFEVPGILGVRALAAGPHGLLYALDVHDGRLLTLRPTPGAGGVLESRVIGHGPLSLRRVGSFLVVDLLLDHALTVYDLSERGQVLDERARIKHDGPIWGFDAALVSGGELLIAATGVEDHPLVRSDDGFGYIDSFAFSYLLPKVGAARELWRVNVSELGVVTPKAPVLQVAAASAQLYVSGYGSDRAAVLDFDVRASEPPKSKVEAWVPGASAALWLDSGALAFADPLLDAWLLRPAPGRLAGSPEPSLELRSALAERSPRASPEERLGEALFFTTLMAPANSSDGAHSRFSCETCHFEGYVDGRVHYTGRADVHAVTKPLRGLFNNRPHFSRALDPDLATVSHHEFRVAGKGNGTDPWFELDTASFPWLEQLGIFEKKLSAESLRRALMAFLMGFSHMPNPAVTGREAFNPAERRGAERFREHCARCHAARLESDVPASALSFESWQSAIFSPEGPIVWASADYQKTGVTPYVHEAGARVPSLRRLYTKWPHFTNGSADTLSDVLNGVRYDDTRFFHENAPADATLHALTPEEIADLGAFLELL
ncbi:MAG TPA: c-type cytochrome [Polyangiaceae bacterium]